ncbi:uncharacterized protein [Asterias amurensis]|uniref:uncharacterized protein n=1 Tax=Asterias amurensis TaxID=7602 RepID=UPI003AB77136
MRLFLSIAILFGTAVTATVCSPTLSTIQGPSQGTSTTTAPVDEDCLSTIDWLDIVFITAVPIAAGFGLLMLLAFLQDLRQVKKSNHSWPPPPPTIGRNRSRKERTYVIDVAYAGRTPWCAKHSSSSGASTNQRLVRLRGTFGFSNWTPFDLTLGKKSEQKMITTTHSIGKLIAVEMKYPSMSRRLNSRQIPSSNIWSCLCGLFKGEYDIKIKTIHVLDTKTQNKFISKECTSNPEQGITTLFTLLPFTAKPAPSVNHFAYFIKNALLLTSTFIPWREGNFTGVRHITCFFAYISYTLFATQVMSEFYLDPSLDEIIIVSFTDVTITMAVVIRAAIVGTVVFVIVGVIEVVFRCAPTMWLMPMACVPQTEDGNQNSTGAEPHQVQSTAGNFYGGDCEEVEEGLLRKSVSAPEMQQRMTGTDRNINNDVSSSKTISKKGGALSEAGRDKYITISCGEALTASDEQAVMRENKSLAKADVNLKPDLKTTDRLIYDDICGDDQSICPENMLECPHKFTCHKCIVCKRTTGSAFYSPGASTSSGYAPVSYNDLYGVQFLSNRAYTSSSCDSDMTDFHTDGSLIVSRSSSMSSLTSVTSERSSESVPGDNFSISHRPFYQEPAMPYKQTSISDIGKLNVTTECETSHRKSTVHGQPDSVDTATSTSDLVLNRQMTNRKLEAGDGNLSFRRCKTVEDEAYIREKFAVYSSALKDSNISSAKVIRTKSYINKFTDMGKGKVVFLKSDPDKNCESKLINQKTKTKKPANAKSSKRTSKKAKLVRWDPVDNKPVDYIIDMAMAVEMPSVTVQTSGSGKLFLFSIRKWLGGLLFKSKVKVGDDYKLEITENDSCVEILDENACFKSMPKEEEERITDQKDDTIMNLTVDHLQGSIFKSSSRLIEYLPSVKGVASSNSWDSISSAQDVIQLECAARLNGNNKNNNYSSEWTVIEMEPQYTASSSTTITDNDFSPDSTPTSSGDSGLSSSSLRSIEATNSDKSMPSDRHSYNEIARPRFAYFKATHAANPTVEIKSYAEYYQPIGFLICHILVVLSCMALTVWSVFSVDGMCAGVFWEWVAVSIIAVLIQVFILDLIKAVILTLVRWHAILQDEKAKPYSVII